MSMISSASQLSCGPSCLLPQVGIYKTDNATKSLAINPGEFVIGRTKGALSSGTNTAASDQEQRHPALAAS
jgi:hypothetical protein